MKNATLKLCVTLALALTIITEVGPTVCHAEMQQTSAAVEESINHEIPNTENTVIVTIDTDAPDYDMWSIPVESRTDSNFGPGFDKPKPEEKVEETASVQCVESVQSVTVEVAVITTEPIAIVEETAPVNVGNRWGITLSNQEKDILARIVRLEAGGESDLGEQAVIEVVFNRVSDGNYPNTVTGVLSQKGQFSTWKNRNISAATPTAKEMANIEVVLSGNTNILPMNTVYFSRGAQNKRVQTRIGGHVFCNK